tara:strand:- start:775 stop:1083 length:309 start_codon:yes stop_codon:yes gene_type:complete
MYAEWGKVGGDVGTLQRYIEDGTPMGGFYTALFEGDLFGAVRKCDIINYSKIPDLTGWILRHAPVKCYGSPEKVDYWCFKGGAKEWNFWLKSVIPTSEEVSA